MKTLLLALLALLLSVLSLHAHSHHDHDVTEKSIQEQLGYPADAKLLIIHADDLGIAHSQNIASFKAMEEGVVSSASIMMNTPWVLEVIQYAEDHPEADLGVHLTLTSEWDTYKTGPLAGKDQVPSLVDEHGYLYPSVAEFAAAAKLEEVETETRTQIDAALAAGIDVTHLDGHMGAMLATDEIAQLYIRLGQEYQLPLRLHEHYADNKSPELQEAAAAIPGKLVAAYGASPSDFPDGMADKYNQVLRDLQPGLNILVLHLGFDDPELQAITVNHPLWGAKWRQLDYDWAMSEEAKEIIAAENIILLEWREVRDKLFSNR